MKVQSTSCCCKPPGKWVRGELIDRENGRYRLNQVFAIMKRAASNLSDSSPDLADEANGVFRALVALQQECPLWTSGGVRAIITCRAEQIDSGRIGVRKILERLP